MNHFSSRVFQGALCAAVLALHASARAQLPFFPGAEGYGGTWLGTAPAGGWLSNATVYHVTNLNDSGAGSFRGAFAENTTNKIIVFDVGGTIQLTSDSLDIKNLSNYYIAGQTAPSPVTIYGNTTQITASSNKTTSNVVLRYLSFRKGTGSGEDAVTFSGGNTATGNTNLIFDHLSASWSEDEILSVTNYNTNVTVQYSMIHDALVSGHAYGSLIRPKIDANVTFHHNLYAHNASRQARFGTYDAMTLTADFRNNVIYNWRDRASYAGGSSESEQEYADVNYVGNYLVAGPNTTGSPSRAFSVDKNVDARVYQSGNFIDADKTANPGGAPNGADTGWGMFGVSTPVTDQTLTQMASPFASAPVTTQSASDAYWSVLNTVGNSAAGRDAIDQRVINNVLNFTGPPGGIGAAAPPAAELASLLATPMTTRPAGWDTDNDGMPDAWEVKHGLNPASAADNKLDFDNDGYINLLEYINEVGEFPAPAPIVFNGAANNRYANILNWKTNDGGVTSGSNWQPSKYDAAVVRSGTAIVDAVGQHARVLQVAPLAGDAAILNITGGWIEVAETLDIGAAGAGTVNHSGGSAVADVVILGGAPGAAGVYNLTGSGTLTVGALGKGASGGAFNFTGGTLAAEVVAFDLENNGGVLAPGASPGLTHVMGNLTNTSGSIQIELAGAGPGQFDRVIVNGALAAGGTLDVNLTGGFTPTLGNAFDLFDFASASGAFSLDLPPLPDGLIWDAGDLLSTGVLTVSSPALVGDADFDNDGNVDGQDFLIWQRNVGVDGQTSNVNGDANGSGVIDGLDLAVWRDRFGAGGTATAGGAGVPEPTSALLCVVACAAAATGRASRSAGTRCDRRN